MLRGRRRKQLMPKGMRFLVMKRKKKKRRSLLSGRRKWGPDSGRQRCGTDTDKKKENWGKMLILRMNKVTKKPSIMLAKGIMKMKKRRSILLQTT
jgi:hypothetical protein